MWSRNVEILKVKEWGWSLLLVVAKTPGEINPCWNPINTDHLFKILCQGTLRNLCLFQAPFKLKSCPGKKRVILALVFLSISKLVSKKFPLFLCCMLFLTFSSSWDGVCFLKSKVAERLLAPVLGWVIRAVTDSEKQEVFWKHKGLEKHSCLSREEEGPWRRGELCLQSPEQRWEIWAGKSSAVIDLLKVALDCLQASV